MKYLHLNPEILKKIMHFWQRKFFCSFRITCITVFDPTNASIFFQSRSNLVTNEGAKQCQMRIVENGSKYQKRAQTKTSLKLQHWEWN